MYELDLDLVAYFVPPMDEHGPGIRLTRTVSLPFCPSGDISLCGESLTGFRDSLGFKLKNLTWDVDRQRFFAETIVVNQDEALEMIPDSLRAWVDAGWRSGSYEDYYKLPDEDEESSEADEAATDEPLAWEENEDLAKQHQRRRPREFNRLFRALIRVMAELYDNESVAYAMDKTKRLFDEEAQKDFANPTVKKFREAEMEYRNLDFDAQWAWKERVAKAYSRLDRIVHELTTATSTDGKQ